jgi:transcriptional regulator with XRE-family HTH domain
MTAPERSRIARERLSRELRRLRIEAGMTGTATARVTGMSQSKLSKIENGMLLPTVTDVERLVTELEASEETRSELVDLVRSLHAEAESRRVVLHRGVHRHQQTVSRIEARAATSRFFQLTLVPGLLQSERYSRVVLATLPRQEQEAAIASLRTRRARLDDPAKRFVFLLSESALRWRMGSDGLMAAQIDHLARMARRPNVRLGVVPWTVDVKLVALHGFQIYDERVVTVSVLTGNATITDPLDVREYLNLFAKLETLALYGDPLGDLLLRVADEHRELG